MIEPVTNRTQGNPGYWDISVANRIEGNCQWLYNHLKAQGYYVQIQTKTWDMAMFPYRSEIDRIRNNVKAIVEGFHKLNGSPEIRYTDTLNWNDANSLEQNLLNVDVLLQKMIDHLRYSGELYSGEDSI